MLIDGACYRSIKRAKKLEGDAKGSLGRVILLLDTSGPRYVTTFQLSTPYAGTTVCILFFLSFFLRHVLSRERISKRAANNGIWTNPALIPVGFIGGGRYLFVASWLAFKPSHIDSALNLPALQIYTSSCQSAISPPINYPLSMAIRWIVMNLCQLSLISPFWLAYVQSGIIIK